MGGAQVKAMLAGRVGTAGQSPRAAATTFDPAVGAPTLPPARRRLPSAAFRPAGRLLVVLALLLVGAAALLVSGIGGGRQPPARSARPPAVGVSYAGVGYRLLRVSSTRTIPQRGGSVATASGIFEIVELGFQAGDRRAHLVSSDLLTLDAGGTYYGVSAPSDVGLSDPRWGALTGATPVPVRGLVVRRAIFDVPPGVLAHPLWLHIGAFDYAGQAPAQILRVANAACCAPPAPTRSRPPVGPLAPSPVLG